MNLKKQYGHAFEHLARAQQAYPKHVLFAVIGDEICAIHTDACIIERVLGKPKKNVGTKNEPVYAAFIPKAEQESTVARLLKNGFKVMVMEEVKK